MAIKSGDKKISNKYEQQKQAVLDYIKSHSFAKSKDISALLSVESSRTNVVLSRIIS